MIELKVSELVASCLQRMIDGEIAFQKRLIDEERTEGFDSGKSRLSIIKEMADLKEDIKRKRGE